MTGQTIDLIFKFSLHREPELLPGIIIGMQEEDGVSTIAPFGGCFRVLRNICAHEPATLVNYVRNSSNLNYTTHTIKTSMEDCYLRMYQFLTTMFYMYVRTKNVSYILFAREFTHLLLPARFVADRVFVMPNTIACSPGDEHRVFLSLQQEACVRVGRPMEYNVLDSQQESIRRANRRLFWKLVIPDVTDFLLSGISSDGSVYDKSIYRYIVNVVLQRDTTDVPLLQ